MTDSAVKRLDAGKVVGGTFGSLGRNFVVFLGLVLIFSVVPAQLLSLYVSPLVFDALRRGDIDPAGFGLLTAGAGLVIAIPSYVATGAITHGTIVGFNGGRARLGGCIATGFARFLPLALLGLCLTLAAVLVFLFVWGGLTVLSGTPDSSLTLTPLFVLPVIGVISTVICVAPAAIVAERTGVFRSLNRSSELTKGDRFRIFGLILLFGILAAAFNAFVGYVRTSFGAPSDTLPLIGSVTVSTAVGMATMAADIVADSLGTMLGASGVAALYFELRSAKEGATSSELAAVFD
jgi:hypothetical protein